MDTELLKEIAQESLWYIGFALLIVCVFVGAQYQRTRRRKLGKRIKSVEAMRLWEEVQKRREKTNR